MARHAVEKTTPEEPLDDQLIQPQLTPSADLEEQAASAEEHDVFGNEEGAEIQYKTCKWWYVHKLPDAVCSVTERDLTVLWCSSAYGMHRSLGVRSFFELSLTFNCQECRHS